MIVQIPVMIVFDCDKSILNHARAAGDRFFTLKYDTDPNSGYQSSYCDHYPPHKRSVFYPDAGGIIAGLLTREIDREIARRAAESPESYCFEEDGR